MFTKRKVIGGGSYRVTKKVIDWEAILGGIVVFVIVVLVIANL